MHLKKANPKVVYACMLYACASITAASSREASLLLHPHSRNYHSAQKLRLNQIVECIVQDLLKRVDLLKKNQLLRNKVNLTGLTKNNCFNMYCFYAFLG
jgi:hypothetical protein